jgi:TonB family protein
MLPQFPGGDKALLEFIKKEMKYPAESVEYGEQGRVVIEITVDAQGHIVNPKVIKSISPSLDREALRIVSKMPRWMPGKKDWMYVDMKYILPIMFKLDEYAPKLEQWPSFPGGNIALSKFVWSEMRCLPKAMKHGDQGRVIVRFLIDAKGNVLKPKIVKGVSPSFDRAALRIVSKMPQWQPAKTLDGKTAGHWWTIHIDFDFEPIG